MSLSSGFGKRCCWWMQKSESGSYSLWQEHRGSQWMALLNSTGLTDHSCSPSSSGEHVINSPEPTHASIDWTCLRMSLLMSWGRNFTSPSRMHKASTGLIRACAVTELYWLLLHDVVKKLMRDTSRASDSGVNLPAVWQMKDSHTALTLVLCWGTHGERTLNLEWRRYLITRRVLKFTKQKCKAVYCITKTSNLKKNISFIWAALPRINFMLRFSHQVLVRFCLHIVVDGELV